MSISSPETKSSVKSLSFTGGIADCIAASTEQTKTRAEPDITDTSHRIRRGYAQAFILNNCTTATIQYIVNKKALIGQVATLPQYRGKMYARSLLYWIGEKLNIDGITVYLFARNHRKSYYEEIGFKEISVDHVLDRKSEE